MNPTFAGLQQAIFGKSTEQAVATLTCVTCSRRNVLRRFRTAEAQREYLISGMCQACQDAVFAKEG